MGTTFAVSRVERAGSPLPTIDARDAIESLSRSRVEAWSRPSWAVARAFESRPELVDGAWVERHVAIHPFVAAVHAAFDQHRPLELSPDAVWLCIAQGFATHVQTNADRLRAQLVSHEGRETIVVRRDDFVLGSPDNPWPEVFTALSTQVAERTGDLHALVVSDFSTTDATSRAASEIALLAAAQPYFGYQMHSLCGIPEITLTGTTDDWRAIERRAAALSRFDLSWWTDALAPVLAQFTRASQGDVDVAFWESLYKLKNASGGPYVTGWINVLLPYVGGRDEARRGRFSKAELAGASKAERARVIAELLARDATIRNSAVESWQQGLSSPLGGGPTTDALPSGLSCVPFLWKFLATEHRMEFLGGFVGVGQDPATMRVRPELGWAVRPAPR
ncbi:DUF4419 domain-containing protein [Sandaracinus amylolyticus]|uniref:DUF4419 domain-containing protein n=1 Tax=Sandaracinus amylolyticus TaxID=927083 RepID=A0A0F6SI90_9BACT|nr:DUF4419 domain-containing protein [Sandaracinus amylolyticus]AKF11779.1 hypothetical protein DB32_008928 [Sandaracinus amylolyticus]